jgi:hypothetical protein
VRCASARSGSGSCLPRKNGANSFQNIHIATAMSRNPAQLPTTMPTIEPTDNLDEPGVLEDGPGVFDGPVPPLPDVASAVDVLPPVEVALGGDLEFVTVAGLLAGAPATYPLSPQYRE